MPGFYFKKGNIPPEFLDFIQVNEKEVIRVTAEVETPRERLRGAFHVVLGHWFNSGLYSCFWNDQYIRTIGGLKDYYKYHGCDGKYCTYSLGGEKTSDRDFFKKKLPDNIFRLVVCTPRPWEKMSKIQQCKALNLMLTEIKQAGDLTKELDLSLSILENDVEALKSIGYYQYCK